MPLSEAAAEMVERHCSAVDGLFEAVSKALDEAKITQVMMISSLTTRSIDELTAKIAIDGLKDMRVLVDTSLRSCVKDCQFQLDLCKAGQKATPVAKTEKEWGNQMRRRATVLKNFLLADQIPVELMPPAVVWKKLTDNPSAFIDFGKELVEPKSGKSTGSKDNADPMKVEFVLNDVPQSLAFPREEKTPMGGALWFQCFHRFCVAVMLATVTPEKVDDKAKLEIDWLTLQGYGFRVAQVASLYGWEMALEVDEAFRRFVDKAYSEAHISLSDCYKNIAKFSQLKVDVRLNAKDFQKADAGRATSRAVSGDSKGSKSSNGQKKKRKRGLCYEFIGGRCEYGDDCKFLHERRGAADASKSQAAAKKKLTPRGLSVLCCGLAAQGLEDCWQIEAREAEELYDGSGIAARVCTEFRLDPSAKIESIGSMLRDEVEQICGSDLGKDLDVWISLGREGQLHSDFWDKAKPTLTSCAERLRKKWADVLGVGVRKAAVGGNIRVPLMKAILEAMQEETAEGLDVSYLDEMDRGVVFGCSGPIPISNCWPTKERRSPHGWYPILRDVWDNYSSTQSFSGEVAKAIEKEVELGRMVPISPIEESKIRATCRLGCVPSYDGNGNLRKIRVIDDLRRNGVNSIIDGHLKETLLLPTVKCAVALAQRCKESARARGDDTDILWVEGDIRGAFRLIRLAEEDTWWATNSIGGRRYRHLAIPFGGESSPLLFMRFSGSDTKIISRLLRCFDVFHRLMIYIDDKGCPTTRKTARITILVMVLVDLILDVDIAFEKFFCSSTPRVLGFQMDLNKEEVHLPEDKKTAILEALGTLSETSAKVPLALVDKTLGRLVWGSVMFQKLRCQLRPFFSVTKALQKKNHGGGRRKHPVKNISVGVGLASAAQYIHEILQQLCSAPFAGLVPSVGLRRAVVMCDSSTSALGGVIVAPGSVSQDNSPADRQPMEWFHVSLSNEKVQLLVRQYIPSFEVGSRPEPGHMCFLELLAAVIALLSCRKGSGVLVLSDNCAAVCALSKLHGKSEPLDLLMRRLTYLWPGLTTQLMKAVHIEGVSNRVADLISRTDLSTLRELLGHEENMREINVDGILDDLWPISDGGSSRCQSE